MSLRKASSHVCLPAELQGHGRLPIIRSSKTFQEGLIFMSTLPLSFRLRNAVVEKHQLEGMDPSDRYFNRAILVKRVDRGYSAKVMYEALERESDVHPTVQGALSDLIKRFQDLGFTEMRTRLNFKGQKYLAEKETWVEYPN